jgi:hypothetical protein
LIVSGCDLLLMLPAALREAVRRLPLPVLPRVDTQSSIGTSTGT